MRNIPPHIATTLERLRTYGWGKETAEREIVEKRKQEYREASQRETKTIFSSKDLAEKRRIQEIVEQLQPVAPVVEVTRRRETVPPVQGKTFLEELREIIRDSDTSLANNWARCFKNRQNKLSKRNP